jgi:glycosyltransferase involved in cell wall biosynthesis
MERLIEKLQLSDNVRFEGILEGQDLVEILNRHRFILVPSTLEETFGLVALEGMACGCVPIVSNKGGLPEAIGKAGLTFETADLNSLVRCMDAVLKDEGLQNALRKAGPKHLGEHHQDKIGRHYIEVIKNICATIS